MTIKIPKAEAVEKIRALLALPDCLSYRAIAKRIGLSPGRVCQIVNDFQIPKRCSHCGVVKYCKSGENKCGDMRPEQT